MIGNGIESRMPPGVFWPVLTALALSGFTLSGFHQTMARSVSIVPARCVAFGKKLTGRQRIGAG